MTQTLTITQPDDWHVHLRDGELLRIAAAHTAARFARALVMPNLQPPVCTVDQAIAYREAIIAALPPGSRFNPIMTLYLTDRTAVDQVCAAKQAGIGGFKLYPAGATTHSDSGVSDINRVMPVLACMAQHGVILQVHGEVTDSEVDVFDREAAFIRRVLQPLRSELPALKIVLEHVTTAEAVDFVLSGNDRIAATITPQHLQFNRNALFENGLRPHYYCRPILKREHHRRALVNAAISGSNRFFLGTDSAPHTEADKLASCGCAGCYTAYAGIEMYAEVFDAMDALDKLEGFASHYGADFYGYPRNTGKLKLVKRAWSVAHSYTAPAAVREDHGEDNRPGSERCRVVPLQAGLTHSWSLA